jgi:NAD dependent epimerase/dehydratase
MSWSSKQVLVTGAGGFIGSHLTEQLVLLGAEVTSFVHYNSRGQWGHLDRLAPEIRSQLHVIAGDLRDASAVDEAVKGKEVVFHLGALISIPYSYVHPDEVVQTNVIGTLNVLMAARQHEVARVVHTSTSEVYGTAQYVPINEKHPLQGQSPYSASKIGADHLCESFFRSFSLPVVTVRPFNTYGPRQSARAVIPTIITQALTQDTISIGSLTPRRDLTFVGDTAAGFILAGEAPEAVGQVINLGTGHDVSIGELLNMILSLVGRQCEVVTDPARVRPPNSEVGRLLADYARAQELLGWAPSTSLEAGLRQTIDWVSQHLADYRTGSYAI